MGPERQKAQRWRAGIMTCFHYFPFSMLRPRRERERTGTWASLSGGLAVFILRARGPGPVHPSRSRDVSHRRDMGDFINSHLAEHSPGAGPETSTIETEIPTPICVRAANKPVRQQKTTAGIVWRPGGWCGTREGLGLARPRPTTGAVGPRLLQLPTVRGATKNETHVVVAAWLERLREVIAAARSNRIESICRRSARVETRI